MKKIAFVIDTIYSPTGGTEKQLLALLKHLDRKRFMPVLCVMHTSDWLGEEFDGCPLYTIGIQSFKKPESFFAYWKFVRFLKKEKIDIVHTFFRDGMRIGITAAKFAGIRFIIAVRRNQGYWMAPFDLKVTKILNRWVDLIISNAHNTKAWAAEIEGFPADRIKVIHNGIETDRFLQIRGDTRKQYRAKLSIPEDSPVIGIVANLRPVKSIDVFIRAAHEIRKKITTAHFIIVGEGKAEAALKQYADDLRISRFVHFLGRRRDIVQILSTFDIGVLASSSESFSNTIVEYLAAGLPVVCTDVGGAREAVEDGVNGFVVPVGDYCAIADKIVDIFQNCKAKALGDASRRKAQTSFSLAFMMSQYEDIYSGDKAKSWEKS